MGQEFVFYSESSRGPPHEGVEHESDIFRLLQLMCRERPEGRQKRSWGPAGMDGETGAVPSGPAPVICHCQTWNQRATHRAWGSSVPALQCPWLCTSLGPAAPLPSSIAIGVTFQQPKRGYHPGSILDFITVSLSPGQPCRAALSISLHCLSEQSCSHPHHVAM